MELSLKSVGVTVGVMLFVGVMLIVGVLVVLIVGVGLGGTTQTVLILTVTVDCPAPP